MKQTFGMVWENSRVGKNSHMVKERGSYILALVIFSICVTQLKGRECILFPIILVGFIVNNILQYFAKEYFIINSIFHFSAEILDLVF